MEVEEISAGFVGGLVPAGDIETGCDGAGFRQKVLLDVASEVEIAFKLFLFGVLFKEHLALDGDAGERAEDGGGLFVVGIEGVSLFVEDLKDPDEITVVPDEGEGDHVACPETGFLVDVGIESGIGVSVGDVDDASGLGGFSGDAEFGGESDFVDAGGDFAIELIFGSVVEKDGSAFAVEDAEGGGFDFL